MTSKSKIREAGITTHPDHEHIEVFGAREHNLKNINVTIPR